LRAYINNLVMPLGADSLGGMERRFARFLRPIYCSRQSLVATAFLPLQQ